MVINVLMPLCICLLIVVRSSMLTIQYVFAGTRSKAYVQGTLRISVCIPLLYILLFAEVFMYFHRFSSLISTLLVLTQSLTLFDAIILFLSTIMLKKEISKNMKNENTLRKRSTSERKQSSTKYRLMSSEVQTSRKINNHCGNPHLENNFSNLYDGGVEYRSHDYQPSKPKVSDV